MAKKSSTSRSGYRDRKGQQRVTLALGILLSFAMVASLILPLLSQGVTNTAQTIVPTSTPAPTLPPPPSNESINFDDTYLHPTGLFTAKLPSGWEPESTNQTATEAQLLLNNGALQSVAELRLIDVPESVESVDDLSGFFDDTWLTASWRRYTSWEKDTERVEDDRLLMDFTLEQGITEYIARQVSYLRDSKIYVARVVTLPNASETLRYVLDNLIDNFSATEMFLDSPSDWVAYFDTETKHIIRYPADWTLTDAAPGLPATIQGDDAVLRVETGDTSVADADAARSLIEAQRSGIEALSAEEVSVNGFDGYRVAYRYTSLDGEVESGLAVVLNESDEVVHIASLRVQDDVDLSSDEAIEDYSEALGVLDTFTLLPDLEASNETVE